MEQCPIAWKGSDGPFPCAFKQGTACNKVRISQFETPCIPKYLERCQDAWMDVESECPICGRTVTMKKGDLQNHKRKLCFSCAEARRMENALIDHVMGVY